MKSEAKQSAFITLRPPLPCVSKKFGAGFAYEIAPNAVKIRFSKVLKAKTAVDQLEISLPSGKKFKLNAKIVPLKSTKKSAQADISGKKEALKVQEILALVRKNQHLTICQTQDVEATDRYTGFSELSFIPSAVPNLNWASLDTSQTFLGRKFSAPILISGMTGGIDKGAEINRRLAMAAEAMNIPMGVGSQRLALENPEHEKIFALKKYTPGLFLIGNIGISQLRHPNYLDMCQRAVDMIEADALAIHLNIVQEVVQVEGDRNFSGLFERISKVANHLSVPLIVKEVGSGIDPASATRLIEMGVSAIDVAGRGGTSWSYIEGLRSESSMTKEVAEAFRDWGIPTAYSLAAIRRKFERVPLIASGGIRDGLTIAKALGIGANMVGVGLPLMRAALISDEAPLEVLNTLVQGLKTAMICTNCVSVAMLAQKITVSKYPLSSSLADLLATKSDRLSGIQTKNPLTKPLKPTLEDWHDHLI